MGANNRIKKYYLQLIPYIVSFFGLQGFLAHAWSSLSPQMQCILRFGDLQQKQCAVFSRLSRITATKITRTAVKGSIDERSEGQEKRLQGSIRLDNGNDVDIISRTVQITKDWSITVWEIEKTAEIVERYWDAQNQDLLSLSSNAASRPKNLDPFGLVSWPGAVVAAQELLSKREELFHSKNNSPPRIRSVLILGAGCGIEAQAVAILGAESVLATDIHPTTLKLLQYGAKHAELEGKIQCQILDVFATNDQKLPVADLIIVADVLYNERLSDQIAERCCEALSTMKPHPIILVSDSQKFTNFTTTLNSKLRSMSLHMVDWEKRVLNDFTGSGVMIDEDQTYNVTARVLWIGLD